METQYNKIRDMIGISAMVVLFSVLWFFAYVQPADEARFRVLECMDGDRSRDAYDSCVGEIRASK